MMVIIRPTRRTALSRRILAWCHAHRLHHSRGIRSLIGVWIEPAPATAELIFEEGGRLHGTDGCNQLSGAWSADSDAIIFEQVALTLRTRREMDTWLGALSTATVDGDAMQVHKESGTEIGILIKLTVLKDAENP